MPVENDMEHCRSRWSSVAELRLLGGVVAIAGALGWLAMALVTVTVDDLLRADAEATALVTARNLSGHILDLKQVTLGERPSVALSGILGREHANGPVFRVRLFDHTGAVRLLSYPKAGGPAAQEQLRTRNFDVLDVFATKRPLFEAKRGTKPDEPAHFAVTKLPLMLGDDVVAVLEAYVDQTHKHDLFHRRFVGAGLGLAALIAFAFAVPAVAWYVRAGQLTRAEQAARQAADERAAAERRAELLADHDGLTGLPNRTALMARLAADLDGAAPGQLVAIYHLDLDCLRAINEHHGYTTGDDLIRAVAATLTSSIGADDVVGRLGSDDFLVIQRNVRDEDYVRQFALRLLRALERPYVAGGQDFSITAAIGVAVAPTHGRDADALLNCAEFALTAAKAAQPIGVRLFDSGMDQEMRERRSLEAEIRAAAAGARFEVHFQPVVRTADGAPVYFEALARMRGSDRAFVPPSRFIPAAEDIGVIAAIGTFVLRHACVVAASWPEQLGVAVNLSPAQFATHDLCRIVETALADSGLAAGRLELEITEGLLLRDTDSVLHQLAELKALGVSIAMDDYGTGYSSLGYLRRFPFDKIKIDSSFMPNEAAGAEHDLELLRAIVDLGHSLNMRVTAEGVETDAQATYLAQIGCDYSQGYFYGRPIPETDVAGYVLRLFAERHARGAASTAVAVSAAR